MLLDPQIGYEQSIELGSAGASGNDFLAFMHEACNGSRIAAKRERSTVPRDPFAEDSQVEFAGVFDD
jgi:hypothetical protein